YAGRPRRAKPVASPAAVPTRATATPRFQNTAPTAAQFWARRGSPASRPSTQRASARPAFASQPYTKAVSAIALSLPKVRKAQSARNAGLWSWIDATVPRVPAATSQSSPAARRRSTGQRDAASLGVHSLLMSLLPPVVSRD